MSVMSRFRPLAVLIAAAGCWLFPGASVRAADAPAIKTRPNILIIVSDDQGYADLGVQGGKDIPTPNIDALANAGTRFTSGYVSGPYCSPTRAGLLTGRYQQRFGHEFNPGQQAAQGGVELGLSLNERTLADKLRSAGYRTGLVGKWHLGNGPKFHPLERGFQEFFGFLGGAHSYVNWNTPNQPILRGRETVVEETYLTDAFAREAVAYIDRSATAADKPFFLYLAFNAVHGPLDVPPQKYVDRVKGIADERRRTYAAMTVALDDAVGAVTARLKATGQDKNTLVFYFSDNGGPPVNASSNGPLRGNKAQTLEGGVRVPFFVSWPAALPAGKTFDHPAIQLDVHATALAAAGYAASADARPLDGVDLLPFLRGEKTGPVHDALYWRFGPQAAIRAGDWKLVRHRLGNNQWELYNLKDDVGELKDLTSSQPEKVKELLARWEAWDKTLVPPAWTAPSPAIRNGQAVDPGRAQRRANRQAAGATTQPAK